MPIEIRTGDVDEVVSLSREVPEFEHPYRRDEYKNRLTGRHLILVANHDQVAAGFKVGYEKKSDPMCLYSWFGGVLPGHRRQGIATALQPSMEEWGKVRGFKKMQFKTLNMHTNMIIFGIRHGFEIYNFKSQTPSSKSKIYFEKQL